MEDTYPELNRAAFLIEHACVPRYVPPICAETAEILALMAEVAARQNPQEHSG